MAGSVQQDDGRVRIAGLWQGPYSRAEWVKMNFIFAESLCIAYNKEVYIMVSTHTRIKFNSC